IFEATIMERTTCNESIKRLTKKGFFSESIDPSDRRLRRVTLTESGKEMTRVATEKMIGLSGLLLGPIPDGAKAGVFQRLT
ncbi:MAG: winged helix DNA-binding protein, partial [Bacteroidota bacterium]